MNDSPAVLVHAKGLRKDYGSGDGLVRALDSVDLDVNRGEAVAVMGRNGAPWDSVGAVSQLVALRSGDVVRIRQVRPDDAPALARAYANLGEQSRYRRFFTVMPELPEATLKAAVDVDHVDHEALVAVPLLSAEIVGECRFIRLPDQPGTAEIGVAVVDAWQGRGLGSALLACLSEHAAEAGIEYFTAEVLAENRTMLALLPGLGQVKTESLGPVVSARVELAEPARQPGLDLPALLLAAARGDIVVLPVLLRRLIRVPEGLAHAVRLPVRTCSGRGGRVRGLQTRRRLRRGAGLHTAGGP